MFSCLKIQYTCRGLYPHCQPGSFSRLGKVILSHTKEHICFLIIIHLQTTFSENWEVPASPAPFYSARRIVGKTFPKWSSQTQASKIYQKWNIMQLTRVLAALVFLFPSFFCSGNAMNYTAYPWVVTSTPPLYLWRTPWLIKNRNIHSP